MNAMAQDSARTAPRHLVVIGGGMVARRLVEGQLEGTDLARCAGVLAWARRRAAALSDPRCRFQVWSIKTMVGKLEDLATEGAGVGNSCAQVVMLDGPC